MEFVWTPLRQTAHAYLPDIWSTSSPSQDSRTFVLPMLTSNTFPSMLVFQRIIFSCSSASDSVKINRSSAYMFSHILYETLGGRGASRTVMNGRGLRQEPWWKPTFTLNSSGCFGHFHTCPVWAAPATPQCKVCENTTRWHDILHVRMPFPNQWRPCSVFTAWCLSHNWWIIIMASLEPLWSGLAIGGFDNPTPHPLKGIALWFEEGDSDTLKLGNGSSEPLQLQWLPAFQLLSATISATSSLATCHQLDGLRHQL